MSSFQNLLLSSIMTYDCVTLWLWLICDTKSYQTLTLAPKIKINRKENKSEREIENK